MKWILILIAVIVVTNFASYVYVILRHRRDKERCDRCGCYRDIHTVRFKCVGQELVCEHCLRKMES